jgi:hypothetical protein
MMKQDLLSKRQLNMVGGKGNRHVLNVSFASDHTPQDKKELS